MYCSIIYPVLKLKTSQGQFTLKLKTLIVCLFFYLCYLFGWFLSSPGHQLISPELNKRKEDRKKLTQLFTRRARTYSEDVLATPQLPLC